MLVILCNKETVGVLLLASVTAGFVMSRCKNIGYETGHFTYSVKNLLVEPHFFHTVNITIEPCNETVLLRYMELACDQHNETFRNFSQTYFPGLGYYVSAFNGVSEDSGDSFWELIEHTTGVQHHVGAHHYIPQHGDHVAWNLTLIDWTKFPTQKPVETQTEKSTI